MHLLHLCGIVLGVMAFDKAWFEARVAESEYGTTQELARHMKDAKGKPLHFSMLYKVYAGTRAMTLAEAYQFASLLGISFEEVCLRALGKKPKR
ncbi:MAG: hypothetical protein EON58_11290 [Alphaproteobacteria bacterium]|nr:MAG: hypothetical protein EON58_11290 [Alphaproteobacteria bacterium]